MVAQARLGRASIGLVTALVMLAAIRPAAAQPVTYLRASWNTESGLPQNTVTSIVQTRDGYLWLGTLGGLVRFDGVRFTVYSAATTPALQSDRIQALFEDASGALWIGTEVGVAVRRGGVFERLDTAGLPHQFVQAFCSDGPHAMWIGTAGGLARHDGTRIVDHSAAFGGAANVQALARDRAGTLWVGTTRGLVEFRNGAVARTYTAADGLPSPVIKALHLDSDQTVWAGTNLGPARLERGPSTRADDPRSLPSTRSRSLGAGRAGRFVAYPTSDSAEPGASNAIVRDGSGTLIAGGGTSVYRLAADQLVPYRLHAAPTPNVVQSLFVDREGTLWVGTDRSGLERWRVSGVTMLTEADGISGPGIMTILEDRHGAVWIGPYCGDLTRVAPDRTVRFSKRDGLANTCVSALHEDRHGRLWVGTDGGGLHLFEAERLVPRDTGPTVFEKSITSIADDQDGRLWVGTKVGVFRFDADGSVTKYRTRDGLVHDEVHVVRHDRAGALWIGTLGGVSRLQDGRFTNFTTSNGLSHNYVRDIHEDADGVVWLATYGGGLNRFKDGTLVAFPRDAGFFEGAVSRILADDRDNLWFSGNRGIYRAARRDLNAYAEGRSASVPVIAYSAADGMRTSETNGGGQPAGTRTRDGRLWFPTLDGVAVFDPRLLANAVPPPVVIELIRADGRHVDVQDTFELPAGVRSLEIQYTALSFSAPEKVRFKYSLEGFDPGWVDAADRRTAYYTNLPPARYRFHVAAANNEGVWNTEGAAIDVVQRPYFYQTPWFAALAIVTLVAAGIGGYRVRVRRLLHRTRQLETRVAERTTEVVAQRNELARVNAQLARANDDMQTVLNRLRAGVLTLDAAGRVTFFNRAALDLLDVDLDEQLGAAWPEVLALGDDDRGRLEAMLAQPAARRARMPLRLDRHGRRFWMEADAEDDPRDPAGRILVLYDVTETYDLRRLLDEKAQFQGLVGESRAAQLVFKQIRDVAPVDTTVLIEGETGTGKELVARAVHYLSPRKHRPFVPVNCAGLTDSLLGSQLFGHRRGAFTGAVSDQMGLFEAAQGGTIFLDEIGDIPVSMQTSLLRVLQEKEITRLGDAKAVKVDVRVLAATHRDLAPMVAAGTFRQDLLYRIRVARIPVPPLRERRDDIPLLVSWFLGQARAATGRPVHDVSRDAMQRLIEHPWPGNVRELKSAIESAALACSGTIIQSADLPAEIAAAAGTPLTPDDRLRILDALARTEGNRAAAARLLGMGRSTLYRRLKELDIDSEQQA